MDDDENKKTLSERLRNLKERFSDWKDTTLEPYYKHTLKPFAKRVKRNYRNRKKDRQKRKIKELKAKNKPSVKIGTIGNIEAMVINGKVIQNKNIPQLLPYNEIEYRTPRPLEYRRPVKRLPYNNIPLQKDNFYRECLEIFNDIKFDYNQNRFIDVIENSKKFINYFLSLLSQFLNIEYYGVDEFLRIVNQRGLQFEFYDETNDFSNYLGNSHFDNIEQSSERIFNIIKSIITKLNQITNEHN